MSESIDTQLANRVRNFLQSRGISQRRFSKLLGIDPGNFNAWLSGAKTLSEEKTGKIWQILKLTPMQLQAKLGSPATQIVHYQRNGVEMRLSNDGWVSGQSGTDPNDSTGIDRTPTARDTEGSSDYLDKIIPFLKAQQQIYRQAIGHIDNYLANVQRAKINRQGPSEAPRRISDSDASSHPGSRGDLLSADKLKEQLEYVRRERKKREEQLELQSELDRERKLYWDARIETLRKQDGQ